MMRRAGGLVVLLALMPAQPSLADDYPFTGDFAIAGDPAAPGPSDLYRCALSFFRQGADGKFTGYHADLAGFSAGDPPRYVIYQSGTCVHDAGAGIESCTLTFETDRELEGRTFVDVISSIAKDHVKTLSFESLAEAQAHSTTGQSDNAFPITYVRRPFDGARLAAALSSSASTVSAGERNQLTSPDDGFLAQKSVHDLAKAMGLIP